MKALKSKLLLSITTLVVAIVAVAGSAYAWFTLSNTAQASVQITVTSGDGLQISATGTDGTYASTASMTGSTISSVTSVDGVNFSKLAVGGALYNTYTLAAASAGADFFESTLFFRTPSNAASYLKLNIAAGAGNSTATQSGTPTVKASEAVRVALYDNVGAPASAPIWEPNKVAGRSYGDNDGVAAGIQNEAWTYFVNAIGAGADYSALTTYITTTQPTQTTNAAALGQVSDVSTWVAGTGANAGYYLGSVTVRVWLEGFDADTFDAIFSQVFNIGLVFTKGA